MQMKILLLVDKKIKQSQLDEMKNKVSEMYQDNAGVELVFFEERRDLSNLPKEYYSTGNEGIKRSYIQSATSEIYKRYAKELHQVVFLVHRDNWNLEGVWGWNLSKVYNGYGVQQCRFDSVNIANAIGTLYHELMHDHDSFIYTYTGKRIAPLVGIKDWDDDVVHGGRYSGVISEWKYIRYNENQKALKAIGQSLREALEEKLKLHFKDTITMLETIIRLQKIVLVLKRQVEVRKRGDVAIKPNNICQANDTH